MKDKGIVPDGGFSMDAMRAFFRANPDRTAELLQENASYIFFREIVGLSPDLGPIGGEGVPLTAGRSIAVDTAFHGYGTPIFIDASVQSGPDHAREPFRRLMIAQDTGSAIKGPARADLFWGTGKEAGSTAGGIKAAGTFYVLLPRP
jgi:membrane-bound lytic murein transglycosylase A